MVNLCRSNLFHLIKTEMNRPQGCARFTMSQVIVLCTTYTYFRDMRSCLYDNFCYFCNYRVLYTMGGYLDCGTADISWGYHRLMSARGLPPLLLSITSEPNLSISAKYHRMVFETPLVNLWHLVVNLFQRLSWRLSNICGMGQIHGPCSMLKIMYVHRSEKMSSIVWRCAEVRRCLSAWRGAGIFISEYHASIFFVRREERWMSNKLCKSLSAHQSSFSRRNECILKS